MNTVPTARETFKLSVSEIALAYPQSLSLFTRHNIDFCCGGKNLQERSLAVRNARIKKKGPQTIRNQVKMKYIIAQFKNRLSKIVSKQYHGNK